MLSSGTPHGCRPRRKSSASGPRAFAPCLSRERLEQLFLANNIVALARGLASVSLFVAAFGHGGTGGKLLVQTFEELLHHMPNSCGMDASKVGFEKRAPERRRVDYLIGRKVIGALQFAR